MKLQECLTPGSNQTYLTNAGSHAWLINIIILTYRAYALTPSISPATVLEWQKEQLISATYSGNALHYAVPSYTRTTSWFEGVLARSIHISVPLILLFVKSVKQRVLI